MSLPTPIEIKNELPLTLEANQFIHASRETMKRIAIGTLDTLALIVGPCSIDNPTDAIEYGRRLKELSDKVSKNCFLVMRVYIEKPRTRLGWKGFLHDPFLDGSDDIAHGIYETRKLFLELAAQKVPIAAELVNPLTYSYFDDLLTWGCIGARTSASQPHREMASLLPFSVGFKNPTDGDIETAINGIITAHSPHTFLTINQAGRIASARSQGNPFTHIVLRGSRDKSNFDEESLRATSIQLERAGLPSRILVDCSHGNSSHYLQQKEVFLHLLERHYQGNSPLMGWMLESHLKEGNVLSLTDPCLGWESTEELILEVGAMAL